MDPKANVFYIFSISLFYLCQYVDGLVVPQELPSILSLVYSNIPPIKKGTDSRLGFGFRLGEHADFQVMVELGPQKETRPIGDQDNDNSFNKRQVDQNDQNLILRQQLKQLLLQKQQQLRQEQLEQEKLELQQQLEADNDNAASTERYASTWLQSWSEGMSVAKKSLKPHQKSEAKRKQPHSSYRIVPNVPSVPAESLKQLQLLYKLATTSTSTTSSPNSFDANDQLNLAAPADLLERLNLEQQNKVISLVNRGKAAPFEKSKAKITKELMDVRLDDDE